MSCAFKRFIKQSCHYGACYFIFSVLERPRCAWWGAMGCRSPSVSPLWHLAANLVLHHGCVGGVWLRLQENTTYIELITPPIRSKTLWLVNWTLVQFLSRSCEFWTKYNFKHQLHKQTNKQPEQVGGSFLWVTMGLYAQNRRELELIWQNNSLRLNMIIL